MRTRLTRVVVSRTATFGSCAGLTHRAPIAFAACAAFVRGVLALLADASLDEVGELMSAAAEAHDVETARRLRDARRSARAGEPPETVLTRYLGWAAHDAVAAALYVLMRHPDDARAALLEAVNSPGDSDSIGALVGALVGARRGLASLPTEWVTDLERSPELAELAHRAAAASARRLLAPRHGSEFRGRRFQPPRLPELRKRPR